MPKQSFIISSKTGQGNASPTTTRKCWSLTENPNSDSIGSSAEFMLEVIGAGATATVDEDWHAIWENSNEYKIFHDEIDAIKTDGAKRPPVETRIKSEYATQWCYQVKQLIRRGNRDMWRNPDYLFAKLALNITGGLFIGFTFFKAKDTLQGTQNKLFAIFMSIILSAPLSNQLQVPFLETRDIYEIRAYIYAETSDLA